MRKQTKLVAVLSAAALLAIGASMTSFAAGWTQEDGTWVYLDSSGDRVTDTWKKSANSYFYLNEDGEMAVDSVIEDGDYKYYVDASGARVVNKWISVDNVEDETIGANDDISTIWYYFGSNGRAYRDNDKTVDGKKYIFDDNGYMISGWYNYEDNWYYLGEENEGWAYTGWQYLEPEENMTPDNGEYDDEEWFYFKPATGKGYKGKRYYIDGKYYAFDDNGVMLNKWAVGTPGLSDDDVNSKYANMATTPAARYSESGALATGWLYAYAVDDPDEEKDDQFWYYLDNKGVPFNLGSIDAIEKGYPNVKADKKNNDTWDIDKVSGIAAKVIKSKTYLFDGNGKMQTGVFKIKSTVGRVGGSDLKSGIYYFTKGGGSSEGSMVTGKATVNYDGDTYNYYFQKNGQAYENQIVDGTLYGIDGERKDATDGNTYEVYPLPADVYNKAGDTKLVDAGTTVIVNANGKIKQSGNVKIDGEKYSVEKYVATKVVE